ncbi:hypothetical protein ACFQZC_02945 [Streptacidiphilus monticola]
MKDPAAFAAFVAELPGAGVVGCAVGTIDDHAPARATAAGNAARSPMW